MDLGYLEHCNCCQAVARCLHMTSGNSVWSITALLSQPISLSTQCQDLDMIVSARLLSQLAGDGDKYTMTPTART